MSLIREISPNDDMYQGNQEHYFYVGESAIQCILTGLAAVGKDPAEISSILDLPCGYGRVLRQLKTTFPNAALAGCDLERNSVDFCARTFGAAPFYSNKDISKISIDGTFDLIWVGSLLTHLDFQHCQDFFRFLTGKLNPSGLLVVSVHGPDIIRKIVQEESTYGLDQASLASLIYQYHENKFAYVNYPGREDYGISISSIATTKGLISGIPELNFIQYRENAWDNHQDILCCQKSAAMGVKRTQNVAATPGRKQVIGAENETGKDYHVVFSLPEGLTIGGVTTWSVEMSRQLRGNGYPTALVSHPSRYHNPEVDFGITDDDFLIDCTGLLHPDDPELNVQDYEPYYRQALPGVIIPNWSWGTYALAARIAAITPEKQRVIAIGHADESGYYEWLVHYEAIIHRFVAVSQEIGSRLKRLLPHRANDVFVRPYPVRIPNNLTREYSAKGSPIKLVYAGRIVQYQKRVFDLLDLATRLEYADVDFQFRIIGSGIDKEPFYARAEQLPERVRRRISLEAAVPPSQMSEVWRTSDINILVSDFEGTSISMLESMAEGCVPVMTHVSGTSAVIHPGENGHLVPVGDLDQMAHAIKNLYLDRNQLISQGEKAHQTVKAKYSYGDYVAWFSEMVDDVWQEPARPWPPKTKPVEFEEVRQWVQRSYEPRSLKPIDPQPDSRTKILFISHDANWGGAPKVLYSLVKGLDPKKWNSIVVVPDHGRLEEEFGNIGIRTIVSPLVWATTNASRRANDYQYFCDNLGERTSQIAEIIEKERIQLVITNTVSIVEGALAARMSGVPHIWYVHELISQDDQLTPILDYPAFYATLDELSNKLVVISKTVENEIVQFYPSQKIELIYTGLEKPPAISPDRQETLGIAPHDPVITFVGVLSERKGVMGLVDVAAVVVKKIPQAKFVLVGQLVNELAEKMKDQIRQKNLDDHFVFLGFRDDIREILSCSDVVVIPSLVEPFSLVAVEAMAAGKPVVATRSGGPAEIVIDQETGILVPVNDPYSMAQAVIKLFANSASMRAMGKNGARRFLKVFRYEEYIQRFDRLIEEVLAQPQENACFAQKDVVDRFVRLTAVAAPVNIQRGDQDPSTAARQLLNYQGYQPVVVKSVPSKISRPKVSVCLPVYNGQLYVRDCIESILAQTFTDFELIVVDDASRDDSESIIQTIQDPRVRYVRNAKNLGLIGNWNRCLELSTGEFVCIFHQDDLMDATNLERKVALIDSDPRLGFVYSDVTIVNQDGDRTGTHWFNLVNPNVDFRQSSSAIFDLLFSNLNLVCCPSVVVRRECYEKLGSFDSRLPLTVDMEMWLRIALFYDVAYIADPLMQYRWHDKNLTHKYLDLDLVHLYLSKRMVLEKFPERFRDTEYASQLLEDSSQRIFDRAIHHFHQGDYRLAKQHMVVLQQIRGEFNSGEVFDVYCRELQRNIDQAFEYWMTPFAVSRDISPSAGEEKGVTQVPVTRTGVAYLLSVIKSLFKIDRAETAKRVVMDLLELIQEAGDDQLLLETKVDLSKVLIDTGWLSEAENLLKEVSLKAKSLYQTQFEKQCEQNMEMIAEILAPLKRYETVYQPSLEKGGSLIQAGKINEALTVIRSVLEHAKRLEGSPVIIEIILESSRLIAKTGEVQEAALFGKKALKLAEKVPHPFWRNHVRSYLERLADPDQVEVVRELQPPLSISSNADRNPSHPEVDVVIPIYGQADLVKASVESVLKTVKNARLILVDDHSPDDEVGQLLDIYQGHPWITVIRLEDNQGFIGATKLGAEQGQAPYILFLNSDTRAIEPNWLGKMIPQDPQIAVVGAKLLFSQNMPGPLAGTIQHAGVARNLQGEPFHPYLGWRADAWEVNRQIEVNAVTGGCFLVRRKVWNELGGWDPMFGKGVYEDVDFCWRVRKAGYKVLYQPTVTLYHHSSASINTNGHHLLYDHKDENLRLLKRKWPDLKSDEVIFIGEKQVKTWRAAKQEMPAILDLARKGKKTQALSRVRNLLNGAPDYPDGLALYATLLIDMGNHEKAVPLLEKLICQEPLSWEMRLKLVDTRLHAGQFDVARRELDKLAEALPSSPEIIRLRERLVSATNVSGDEIILNTSSPLDAMELFEVLLNAPNLEAALQQYESDLGKDLYDLVAKQIQAARDEGETDLAEGLQNLADYIHGVMVLRE